jgi:hypothetical protein
MVERAVVPPTLSADEIVFRRVLPGMGHYSFDDANRLRVSPSAFADRELQPSVDREMLLRNLGGASFTRQLPQNAVVRLKVADVRAVTIPKQDSQGRTQEEYVADVEPRPLPENAAHCVIKMSPSYSKGMFRKLQERLALLADWEIPPSDGAE